MYSDLVHGLNVSNSSLGRGVANYGFREVPKHKKPYFLLNSAQNETQPAATSALYLWLFFVAAEI